jgi:flagellin-like protein
VKGISPLIAAVILIAFTTAIAGIMATWATSFVQERTGDIGAEAECIGALDISTPSFSGKTFTLTVKNTNTKLTLETIKATLYYSNVSKNRQYELKDYGVADPLPPLTTDWASINTSDTTKPLKVEAISATCPKQPAMLSVP